MPRNQEQNEKMKEERRRQILSVALRLFAQRGLAATKITDIAQASEISQGLLYHYYCSKEEIYAELIQGAFERMNGACRWLASQPWSPREKIGFAIAELLKLLEQDDDASRYHLLIAQATVSEATPAEVRQIIARENRFPYESIARIMAEGQRDGTVKANDPQELALAFWGAINGLAIYKAVHGAAFRAPDPRILSRMFLRES